MTDEEEYLISYANIKSNLFKKKNNSLVVDKSRNFTKTNF